MEKEENIDLPATSEVNGARATENFISTCNRERNDSFESPSTSTNGNKQKTISSADGAEKDVLTEEETKSAEDEMGAVGNTVSLDCPICLQACIHPARLPCGHIFCFLCIKGVAYKNQRCAMCRREIPVEFLDRPELVNGIDDLYLTKCTEDGYQWFYEGRNGWWQYDVRTSQDIEDAYKQGEKSCTILVAGYVYSVDLETMVQQRQNEPTRCRRVKRDLATVPKKGVAGLRLGGNSITLDTNCGANVVGSHQEENLSSSENRSIGDQPQSSSEGIVLTRQFHDFVSTSETEQTQNLEAGSMPLINLHDQQSSAVTTNFAPVVELPSSFQPLSITNFFSNTVQINALESEQQPDDEFQETLASLQILTLRATDALNSVQNEQNDRWENNYRNNRC